MARVQVPGPILHFVNFVGDPNNFWFLGTSKVAPKIRIDRAYAPIKFEQRGNLLPFDLVYQGKEAKIITQINYFDYSVAYLLGCSPRYGHGRFALGRGLDDFKSTGSLALGNKGYFTLYIVQPFASTANDPASTATSPLANGNFNMPLVYRFGACQVLYDDIATGGASEQELMLAINVLPIYYSRAKYKSRFSGSPLAGGFFIYDHKATLTPSLIEEAMTNSLKNSGSGATLRSRSN